MDLGRIKEIVNNELLTNQVKEGLVIDVLSSDKEVILVILKILSSERENKDELISDMNLLLSKAHLGLDDPKFNEGGFMQQEIIGFYQKYKDFVGHCFKKIK